MSNEAGAETDASASASVPCQCRQGAMSARDMESMAMALNRSFRFPNVMYLPSQAGIAWWKCSLRQTWKLLKPWGVLARSAMQLI